jgi:hypothetical protein
MGCCDAPAPICQSCALPLSVPEDCGTNADGSPSAEYCRHCFQAGAFTAELGKAEMIERLVGFSAHLGMTPKEARRTAESTLPTLKRWASG